MPHPWAPLGSPRGDFRSPLHHWSLWLVLRFSVLFVPGCFSSTQSWGLTVLLLFVIVKYESVTAWGTFELRVAPGGRCPLLSVGAWSKSQTQAFPFDWLFLSTDCHLQLALGLAQPCVNPLAPWLPSPPQPMASVSAGCTAPL